MSTLNIAKKITRYAEALGFTVERHASGVSESVYLTLWYAPALSQPLRIRVSDHTTSPMAVRQYGLGDFEIGGHSARCRDMAECLRWLRGIAGRELPPKLAISMQHDLHQSGAQSLVTLYHFCNESAYDALQRQSYLNGDGRRASRFIRDMEWRPYQWMAEQMEKRLLPKPANAGKFPVWAWHTHGGKQPPDLRTCGLGLKGERTVMLTFKLPASDVLLSDEEEWHIVLNNGHCTDNEAEHDQWEELEKVWPQERFAASMRISWEKIFDPLRSCDPTWCGAQRGEYVQACFWVLERSSVIAEKWFVAR